MSTEIISNNHAEAKRYAEIGWRVVPCHTPTDSGCSCGRQACKAPGKHPRLRQWQTKATDVVEQVRQWWEKWPDANVGVRLGPESNLIDIEFDSEEGEATAKELLGHIDTPKYRSHRSTHHLFTFPANLEIPKAVVEWRGLEIRFGTNKAGAISVFPPSIHATGKEYEWIISLDEVGLAEPPTWLADAIVEESPTLDDHPSVSVGGGRLQFTMQDTGETLSNHPGEGQGNRHRKCMELVGRYAGTYGIDANLMLEAEAWASRCSPPFPREEVGKIVAGIASKEYAKVGSQSNGAAKPEQVWLKSRRYNTIEPSEVEWLWDKRIAVGKLTMVAGEPGLGKTFLLIDIAARISQGEAFPDGAIPPQGEVAILTAEDGANDTIRPRLDAAGADVSKIHHIDGVGEQAKFVSLADDLASFKMFLQNNPEVRAIVIDPISAFLGKTDSHRNAEVRDILGPISDMAEQYHVAILCITHFNKGEGKAINKTIGSIAFVAAARSAWAVVRDPKDTDNRLFLPIKNNLAKCDGLSYSIGEDMRLVWGSVPIKTSLDDIGGNVKRTPRIVATETLTAWLSCGPMATKELEDKAEAAGIKWRTLRRAKEELEVEAYQNPPGKGPWFWRLPTAKEKQEGIDWDLA